MKAKCVTVSLNMLYLMQMQNLKPEMLIYNCNIRKLRKMSPFGVKWFSWWVI